MKGKIWVVAVVVAALAMPVRAAAGDGDSEGCGWAIDTSTSAFIGIYIVRAEYEIWEHGFWPSARCSEPWTTRKATTRSTAGTGLPPIPVEEAPPGVRRLPGVFPTYTKSDWPEGVKPEGYDGIEFIPSILLGFNL